MRHILATLFIAISSFVCAQQVNWTTIEKASQNNDKPLYIVDFYTDWCGYCKKMDRETFTDPTVIRIINKYYTPVKFNAEGRSNFNWNGMKYTSSDTPRGSRRPVHMFAKAVLGQHIGFPSFAFFTSDQNLLTAVPGYYKADQFVVILWYFASGDYKKYNFERYNEIFDKQIKPIMEKELSNK